VAQQEGAIGAAGQHLPLGLQDVRVSLNVPLTPLRMASHSTRTTHPVFMRRLQDLIDAAHWVKAVRA
jgi:hypothetical protein